MEPPREAFKPSGRHRGPRAKDDIPPNYKEFDKDLARLQAQQDELDAKFGKEEPEGLVLIVPDSWKAAPVPSHRR
jgi:hypothetical protein